MANNSFILGNLATSGSVVVNDKILFSTFENSANFEVPDFIASSSGEISLDNNTFIFNQPISSSALIINNVYLETTESSISAGSTTLGEFPTSSYKSLYIDYLISSGSLKARAGQLISTWKQSNVTFTDVSAKSIGDTSDAEFSVVINGVNADLKISSSDSYDVSISSRAILEGTNFALGGGNLSSSPFPFSGAAIITGPLNITGSIIPGGDGIYDLGDATHFWRTASIEHIVTLGDTIEFRDKSNKNTKRGTLKLDAQGGLKVRGGSNALTTVSASHGHFTGDMNVAGNLTINGISDVSASIAAAASSGGDSSNRLAPSDTGSLVTTGSFNTFTSSIQTEVDTLTAATSSYLTSIPSTYFNSSLLETQNITKDFNYTSSLNIVEITSSVEGAIIDYRLTNLDSGSRVGTFMYAHDGTTLSYNDITIPGAGIGADPILSATLTGSIVSLDIENAAGFNFSGFAKKFSKLSVPIVEYDPNVSYFLDIVDNNPAAAFSLRQLSQSYTGSVISVRRDSDNTELDIGFNINGDLDTAAIISHCGSANGYVTTWYDQSGNGNDATNTTGTKQWAIYNGSSVYTVNGKPAMYSNNTNNHFNHTLPAGTSWSAFDVIKGDNSSTIGMHTRSPYAPSMYLGDNTTQTSGIVSFNNAELYQNTQQMSISTRVQFRDDVNNAGHQLLTFFGDYNLPSATWFLGTSYGANYGLKGWLQESIIYNTDEASKRSDYETSINNYYSMYDTGLLEDYPGAAAAYSVRQLTTAVTSSMNIRRASDNTEQVIGFTSAGDLDTGSIETFCAGTECYVDTWYDQSGNGNHAEQTNAAYQPLIYSTNVVTENGKTALEFTPSQQYSVGDYDTFNFIHQGDESCISIVTTYKSGKRIVWGSSFGGFQIGFGVGVDDRGNTKREASYIINQDNQTPVGINRGEYPYMDSQSHHLVYHSGSNATAALRYISSVNGSPGPSSGFNTSTITPATGSAGALFKIPYTNQNPGNAILQELIVWNSTPLSSSINSNINSYFNIY